jgi:DNA-binding transcriptional MerR regulator
VARLLATRPRAPVGPPARRPFLQGLTWPHGARFTLPDVGRHGLRAAEVAARSGVSRKALRLYEAMGILPPPARTDSGYRAYGHEVLALLRFIARARQLGFSLAEIRDIAAIRRSGQPPCPHVQDLVHRKVAPWTRRSKSSRPPGGLSAPCSRRGDPRGARWLRSAHISRKEVSPMEPLKVSLCPACGACPEVEVLEGEVRIGEAGNPSVLKKEEWNVPVELIRSGQLTRL